MMTNIPVGVPTILETIRRLLNGNSKRRDLVLDLHRLFVETGFSTLFARMVTFMRLIQMARSDGNLIVMIGCLILLQMLAIFDSLDVSHLHLNVHSLIGKYYLCIWTKLVENVINVTIKLLEKLFKLNHYIII